jgi:hypothetical protein
MPLAEFIDKAQFQLNITTQGTVNETARERALG